MDEQTNHCNNSDQPSRDERDPIAYTPRLPHDAIGYIDDDEDDVTSDNISNISFSLEDDKVTMVDQDQSLPELEGKSDPSTTTPNHILVAPSGEAIQDILCNGVPQNNDVPSEQPVQIPHSNRSELSEEKELKDYHNALRAPEKGAAQIFQKSSVVIPDGPDGDVLQPDSLETSMVELKESLHNRAALAQFEKFTRRKPNATMNVAKMPENIPKNRYKDVLPYDESRVILTDYNKGDYINASFVNMKVPPLGVNNTYVATQGPLPHTCSEFWQMIWEQNCQLVVMVTTLKERNRVKCHKYWPDLYQILTFGHLQITCFRETATGVCVTRDLLVVNDRTNEERHVIQLQHVTWPDHGVPQDATDFLGFIQHLRRLRQSVGGTVTVHCSAGVGRTGVLILMETAMCYIEAGEPVYPSDLVKAMREQRVMMVQTVNQYKFVCEAILKIYNDYKKTISNIR